MVSVASSTVVSDTSISVTLPAGSVGDLLLLIVLSGGDDDPVVFGPGGWTWSQWQPNFPAAPTVYLGERTRQAGDVSVTVDLETATTATAVVVNTAPTASVQWDWYGYADSSPFSETEPVPAFTGTTEVVGVAVSESGVVWSDSGTTIHTEDGNTGQDITVRTYSGSTATMAGDPSGAAWMLLWAAIAETTRFYVGKVGFRL